MVLLTGFSNLYKTRGNNNKNIWRIRSLTRERRNSDSKAIILLTVVAASPGTIIAGRIKSSVAIPWQKMIRNTNAATLAIFWGELVRSLLVIVFLQVSQVSIGS